MGYKVERPSMEEAKAAAADYEYALLYRISDLLLCPASVLKAEDWEECLEARLFREDAELHLLLEDGEEAVKISDDGEEDVLIREYKLNTKSNEQLSTKGGVLVVKQYLTVDEDGQMSIGLSRLAGIR